MGVGKRFPNDTTLHNRHGFSCAFLMAFFTEYTRVFQTEREHIEGERGTEIKIAKRKVFGRK